MRFVLALVAAASLAANDFGGASDLDAAISKAIVDQQIPGAVVVIGRDSRPVFQKVYGWRSLVPQQEPMTADTIFDAASLTKVVATAPSIMKLVEMGKIRLADKVTDYIPEYLGGKTDVTIHELLTHFSGLRPVLEMTPVWAGYDAGIQRAVTAAPAGPPSTRFVYSDINYILLGEIVRRTSGQSLADFAREKIFLPLGMTETTFLPSAGLVSRIAPTEPPPTGGLPLRGLVHDDVSRNMGGIAGHAGLFTTAADLTKYAEMVLNLGERNGVRIFSPLTIRKMTTPQSPATQTVLRGLGWDINSPYSGSRGDLYPVGSFGHTGFTGTSMWMDPQTNSYVILLTNAVHPKRKLAITGLRSRVATIAAANLQNPPMPQHPLLSDGPMPAPVAAPTRSAPVLTGLDVLVSEGFAQVKNKRVGLITNHTGLNREGKRNVDLMIAAGVNLASIYSPEHGLTGSEDHENIDHSKDPKTGIRVWSLYAGQNRRPSDEMLKGIDLLVFDIQDIGARFYTYISTMAYAMEEAAKRKIPFVVLDRPNPITGTHVEGPMLDDSLKSFIGVTALPLRHGMTIGELAQLLKDEMTVKPELTVIKMQNWARSDWFDSTGLTWVNPSPNMRSLNAALLYPGIGMLEGGKVYSVGRGTDAPFEQIGADWLRGGELARYLNARSLPGIRIYPTELTPSASNFAGKRIEGIRFVITDREAFNSARFGIEVGVGLAKLFPGRMNWTANEKLVGNRAVLQAMEKGEDPAEIERRESGRLQQFLARRLRYLLY